MTVGNAPREFYEKLLFNSKEAKEKFPELFVECVFERARKETMGDGLVQRNTWWQGFLQKPTY